MIAQPAIARRIGFGLLAACTTVLTACAAGQQASTAHETPAIDANNASVGAIDLRAVAILPPPSDQLAYAAGSTVALTAVIVNTGNTPDTLTQVSSSAGAGFEFVHGTSLPSASASDSGSVSASGSGSASDSGSTPASASTSAPGSPSSGATSVEIGANSAVSFGVPTSTMSLALTGLTQKLYAGQMITITFTFAKAGSVSLQVPVQLANAPGTSTIPAPSETSVG